MNLVYIKSIDLSHKHFWSLSKIKARAYFRWPAQLITKVLKNILSRGNNFHSKPTLLQQTEKLISPHSLMTRQHSGDLNTQPFEYPIF